MFDIGTWLWGLAIILAIAVVTWMIHLPLKNASIVDSVWSLLFLAAALAYSLTTPAPEGTRRTLILVLVAVWALRLSGYITWRNWGEGEDYRYRRIRENNSPGFGFKSLYIVFGLQAFLEIGRAHV